MKLRIYSQSLALVYMGPGGVLSSGAVLMQTSKW